MELTDDVKFVKGVGPNRVKLLNKLHIIQENMKIEASQKR